ncbi:unnamed protein product [Urochloa humidicola]
MAYNGMDHCSANAIGAMDLQCLGLGGSCIDVGEPALTQRGCCRSHSAKGRESRLRRRWSPSSPHLLAARASAFPHLHPHRGRYVKNRPEYSPSPVWPVSRLGRSAADALTVIRKSVDKKMTLYCRSSI